MARTKISEFSSTPGNNTDIDGINVAEGCAPSGINDAIRELMSQLKDFQTGSAGDSFNGPVGTTTAAAGAFTTLSASSTVSGTGFSTYLASPPAIGGTAAAAGSFTTLSASSTVTLSGGTANGVLYLNGSKVATSGSALTFNGSTVGVTAELDIKAANNLLFLNSDNSNYIFLNNPAGSGAGIGQLAFTLGGVGELMRLTSTGLGIGTSSPSAKLTVNDTNNIPVRIGDIAAAPVSQTAVYVGTSTSALSGANGDLVLIPRTSDARSILFYTGNGTASLRATLDSSGNLGLGVTPSAWNSGYKAIQNLTSSLYGTTSRDMNLGANVFVNSSGNYAYIQSSFATNYTQYNGAHSWYYAASGTAGNAISFTQAMTLDASGNLGIGVTNPGYRFRVDGGYSVLGCYNTTSFPASLTAGGSGFSWNRSSGGAETNICNLYDNASLSFEFSQKTGASTANRLYQISSTSHIFFISDSEKARIDSSGNLMVNTTSAVGKFTAGGQSTDANNVITGANIVAGTVLALRERGNSAGISGATYASQMFVGPAGGNLEIYTVPSTAVVFGTAATERARITSGGDFLVGTTSTTGLDDGSSTNPGFATGSGTINLQRNNAANIFLSKASGYTSSAFVNFFVAGGAKGSITTDGTNVAYNTSSDYRLKDNPQPLTGSGAFIDALKPKTWTWKADGSKGVGFIAHEVQEVSPGSVVGEKDGEQMQAMEYGSAEFIANIIAELQSLRKRLADAGL